MDTPQLIKPLYFVSLLHNETKKVDREYTRYKCFYILYYILYYMFYDSVCYSCTLLFFVENQQKQESTYTLGDACPPSVRLSKM